MSMKSFPFIFFYSLVPFSVLESFLAADTLTTTQSIFNDKTLVSSCQTFVLGLFSPSGTKNRYLGIWYKKFPDIVVWVANRENPVTNAYAVLTLTEKGNLVILDQTNNSTIWSTNTSRAAADPVAQLLEAGNLVVRDKSIANSESYLWQSFDYISDTQLLGMKIGWNLNTGLNRYLTSWRSASDPSPGNYTYRIDNFGLPQFVLRDGSAKKFRSGPWNGVRFSGFPNFQKLYFKTSFVYNTEELYNIFDENSVITRLRLDESGLLQNFVLNQNSSNWEVMYTVQDDLCDEYGQCGANGFCRLNQRPICECLKGFVPKSQKEWEVLNWSSGCVRRMPLDCQKREGFVKYEGAKMPDLLEFWVNNGISLKECEEECLKNCSCTAYANANISNGGSGCLMWYGDLIDMREFIEEDSPQDIYIRMPVSELESMGASSKEKRTVILVVLSTFSGFATLGLACWFIIRTNRRWKRGLGTNIEDLELPLFDFVTIASATNNFSVANKIGEGGFGPVYKGELLTGQAIAVKRLSNNSGQGLEEFMNEVIMIAKLQHRNLVRLLGCCIEERERMLIYEYMPNKSLDCFIFDQSRRASLNWHKRFDIIMGIARGLLYLHQDSRLRIIHRDLKTSNILLDSELNPKISDFGIARIFRCDQMEAKTKRVVGTFGYMSPEYAIDGKFSAKSDIFSLGVLLLETVSGKKNRNFSHPDHLHNLLGHAWLLWNQDKPLELIDQCLEDSCVESPVLRCIHVGLLCVQKLPEDRPSMSSVVFMLGNEGAILPQPKQPGFFIERSSTDTDTDTGTSTTEQRCHTENEVTITMLEAR